MIERRFLAACVVVAVSAGCAGTQLVLPQSRGGGLSISLAQRPQTTVIVTEEFDPLPYRDDLLLIQPVFDRSDIGGEIMETLPDTAIAEAGPTPIVADGAATLAALYRVQVIALSDEDAAQRVVDDITESLNVAVAIVPERGLFLVQAGAEEAAQSAAELRDRIAALDADYGQAYILAPQQTEDVDDFAVGDFEQPESADEPEVDATTFLPDPERITAFGWRVLIDQFLSHGEAEKLRQKAAKRLDREDVSVVFSPPYYKVEVGNFRSETDAQLLVEKVKNRGYRNALKVRAKVFVSEEEGQLE